MSISLLKDRPVRNYLKDRQPLIPHPKLVDMVGDSLLQGQAVLPAGMKPEDALEVVANSSWARGVAEGVCGMKYVGFAEGSPEYAACVYNVSHRVAAKTLGLSWSPPTEGATPRRRR